MVPVHFRLSLNDIFHNIFLLRRIVTRRAVVTALLRWYRFIFDREAGLVPVYLSLCLYDLFHNASLLRRIVTRRAGFTALLHCYRFIFDREAGLVTICSIMLHSFAGL